MLDKIIRFSIQNKLIIGLLTLALIVWGIYSLTKLPIDAVPDITDNQVMVITVSPTLAAQEVEQLVTFPVEQTMVSIPNIDNMRSFSRFGLSIVTIVFKDDVDLYWARQQVQERLSQAAKNIPEGIGTPEMAPVTTGLGEIYQYVVHTKEGYKDKYDATELRTIQDWIIKRQLLGTPGVAEVSGFGGYVKQYQIAVNPDKLKSLNISINDIFTSLEENNQNTGGAYIDKNPNAYFIRTEGLVKNLDEIGKIVVKHNEAGTPILIRDIATVEFGSSVRYGAATRNAEGEVVTGIVMMLKGANSSEVIKNVKEKMAQIEKTLPEGVVIEPYLDRKNLVDSTIYTVSKNLIEGALIVIFVLILFLGNLRGGLVVASVIPLAMLFAFGMMSLFGVSGNLMSLGAIDFGLVVDGTVIIVESVMHGISTATKRYPGVLKLNQSQMNQEVFTASSKIRTSAAFGEIIILMVYLPLWTLTGIEGKTFTPMAQTVSFAILGAFILSLTYVPMMSSLALSRSVTHKPNISDRMMAKIQKFYHPVIEKAIHHKKTVLSVTLALFLVSLFTLSRMGGEFIPQLDEGDFAVETRVPVGSSMLQSIEVSQKAQRIILDEYPDEVIEVINKIGSGEIPTDPMPIEAGDMMIVLKPKDKWKKASNREELTEKMNASLSVIPNATFSFQQPIQMRFNELLTGAKQDVVMKIYGEDLDKLSELADNVGKNIRNIEGVNDLYIEEITGLPQIQVLLNRDKIAQYGMSVNDINRAVEIGFAGQSAGLVYEGERRFDLVVRLDKDYRADITDVQNIFVTASDGTQVPLSEVAEVVFKPGPVQIQRDNAKRRITIGFNVRGRDVKSTVSDIKSAVDKKIKLPSGYYMTYGGQFENLQKAQDRLSITLPIALFLILLLLYFTFKSVKQSLLIFTAIPLSAIGGVFALFIRGIPFSISAGVGFIALFGVAVLNGIVLIAEFNRLAKEGVDDIYERVLKGTSVRLRPVLMTATVASLGFLPMALSTTAGAEVQRPLATVVIGGLISATLLTLVVLPILYIYFTDKLHFKKHKMKMSGTVVAVSLLLLLLPVSANAQEMVQTRMLNLEQAIEEALRNNNSIKIAQFQIEEQKALKGASIPLPKTEITYGKGVISTPGVTDNSIGVRQQMEFPTLYLSQLKLAKRRVESARQNKVLEESFLIKEVKYAYWFYAYTNDLEKLYTEQRNIYKNLSEMSLKRYQAGESTKLESVTSSAQYKRAEDKLVQVQSDIRIAQKQLQTLLHTSDDIRIADNQLDMQLLNFSIESADLSSNPKLALQEKNVLISKQQLQIEKSKLLPDIILGFNSQTYKTTLGYSNNKRFNSFEIGIAVPLFFNSNLSRIKAAGKSRMIAQTQMNLITHQVENEVQELYMQYQKLSNTLKYYQNDALPEATLIVDSSKQGFANGDISYTQYLQNLSLANDIRSVYLETLLQYNQTVASLEAVYNKR